MPTGFRQIIVNLVGNAIKFTDTGNISVRVSVSEDAEVSESPANQHSDSEICTLLFVIQDTGMGIPEDRQERIFEDFIQTHGANYGRRYGETGLGLSISRHLARLMHGEIWVESVPGVGSIF